MCNRSLGLNLRKEIFFKDNAIQTFLITKHVAAGGTKNSPSEAALDDEFQNHARRLGNTHPRADITRTPLSYHPRLDPITFRPGSSNNYREDLSAAHFAERSVSLGWSGVLKVPEWSALWLCEPFQCLALELRREQLPLDGLALSPLCACTPRRLITKSWSLRMLSGVMHCLNNGLLSNMLAHTW